MNRQKEISQPCILFRHQVGNYYQKGKGSKRPHQFHDPSPVVAGWSNDVIKNIPTGEYDNNSQCQLDDGRYYCSYHLYRRCSRGKYTSHPIQKIKYTIPNITTSPMRIFERAYTNPLGVLLPSGPCHIWRKSLGFVFLIQHTGN